MFPLMAMLMATPNAAVEKDTRVFELRIYYAAKGKLDALNARFRDHTVKLFEKHGIENIGYWTPIENPDERLIYLIAHKSEAAAKASWKAFIADPDWKAAAAASEKDGKILSKIEKCYLTATDYSLLAKPSRTERVFELRTYIATPNNLDALNARFRDHTVKLFEKHGIANAGYFTVAANDPISCGTLLKACTPTGKDEAEGDPKAKAAPVALVYLIAHASTDAAAKSFDAFRKDPAWLEAREASEKKAGGVLTVKDGVKSLMLKPTDYSPLK